MPVYDYECGQCAHKFEQRRSFSEGALATCPQCSSEAKRIFAPVPIVFKGSGFYVTDYRKEKAPVEAKTTSKPSAQTSGPTSKCDGSACKN
jgi:putative FmdB family regulatory protein